MQPGRHTWRVQGIPRELDRNTFTDILRQHPQLQFSDHPPRHPEWSAYGNGAVVETLVPDHCSECQVATIAFFHLPMRLVNSHNLKIMIQQGSEFDTGQKRPRNAGLIEITLDDLFEGITVLVSPPSGQHHVDVLALSGLGSHPFGSFINKEDEHMWLVQRLPKDMSGARVMIYGYDTKLQGSNSFASIETLGNSLETALNLLLHSTNGKRLILIGHSLGGLLVKEAIIRMDKNSSDLFNAVSGALFFGVPNDGMDVGTFSEMVTDQPNATLLDSISFDNPTRLAQKKKFIELLERSQLKVFCWSETQVSPTPIQSGNRFTMTGPRKCLVTEASATSCLPETSRLTHVFYMDRSHSDLVKFSSHDTAYNAVIRALSIIFQDVYRPDSVSQVPSMWPEKQSTSNDTSLSDEEMKALLESLSFEHIDSRNVAIKKAYMRTCRWLLNISEYTEWLDPTKLCNHHGFLWIKGKPGTGKSTLMKFAFLNARRTMNGSNIISFFFSARGAGLEKSVIGMYRSLLLQLLEAFPELQNTVSYTKIWRRNKRENEWTIDSLKAFFEDFVLNLGQRSLICFIDALDECDQTQLRDMISFFEDLCEEVVSNNTDTRFLVCFSSRHYPHITISNGKSFILEEELGHIDDIITYVDNKLKVGTGKLGQRIKEKLQAKSSGVFMWIVLVVDILNEEYDGGRNTQNQLERKLEDIPGDLHALFQDILVRDSNRMNELLLCIQLVLFQTRPLHPEEVYFAIHTEIEINSKSPLKWDHDEINDDDIRRYLNSCSKGLVEITRSRVPTVQFIHDSVRDFLLKDNGIGKIWHDLESKFEGESHNRLKECCLKYMCVDISSYVDSNKSIPPAASLEVSSLQTTAKKDFPFLEYAIESIMYHADAAERCGITQAGFLHSFDLTSWIMLANFFEKHGVRHYTFSASFLYILAERNCSHLIDIHPLKLSYLEVENERYGAPLFAALALNNHCVVRTFLEAEIASQPSQSKIREACEQYLNRKSPREKLGRDFKFQKSQGVASYLLNHNDYEMTMFVAEKCSLDFDHNLQQARTLLLKAIQSNRKAAVKFLLGTGKVDADSKDCYGQTMLSLAAMNGHEAIVRLLLDTGMVDVNSKDQYDRTPLSYAAKKGHEAIVRLLVDTGKVDVDSKDHYGKTPVLYAAMNGYEAIVRLLLGTGIVDAGSKNNLSQNIFLLAAKDGHEAIVRLLLNTGFVDVDSKDYYDKTPLSYAAMNGHEAIVRLLLDTGKVDMDSKDYFGQTPLLLAIKNGHEAIIKLLVSIDKVNVSSRDYDG